MKQCRGGESDGSDWWALKVEMKGERESGRWKEQSCGVVYRGVEEAYSVQGDHAVTQRDESRCVGGMLGLNDGGKG